MNKYILDTNVYDYLLDNEIDIVKIRTQGDFYSTTVQSSEIVQIKNQKRKEDLLGLYKKLNPKKIFLRSGIWIDDLVFDDEQPWIDDITEEAKELRGESKKVLWKDALIGEIAKVENLILVTNDRNFREAARTNGIKSIDAKEFLKQIEG